MTSQPRILALSRDRGSMQAIAPVIVRLSRARATFVTPVSTRESRPVLDGLCIASAPLNEEDYAADPAGCIATLFDTYCPDLLLCGSSPARGQAPETPEQFSILEARRRSVIAVSVQDYWGMYAERFSGNGLDLDPALLPDLLCVLDRHARDSLAEFGVPPSRMAITHNPWLDQLVAEAAIPADDRKHGTDAGLVVLFASQPLAAMQALRKWPYDQFAVFDGLLAAMPRQHAGRHRHRIIVLPHPSEDMSQWRAYLSGPRRPDIQVELHQGRTVALMREVDYLVTSHSTLAYEAAYFDTPCIAFRPADVPMPPLWIEQLGLSRNFSRVEALREYLEETDPVQERQGMQNLREKLRATDLFFSDGRATGKVLAQIMSLLDGAGGISGS